MEQSASPTAPDMPEVIDVPVYPAGAPDTFYVSVIKSRLYWL